MAYQNPFFDWLVMHRLRTPVRTPMNLGCGSQAFWFSTSGVALPFIFWRVRKRRKPNANPFQEGFKKAWLGGWWWLINPKHPKSSKYHLNFGVLVYSWGPNTFSAGFWMSRERDKKQRRMKQNQDIRIEDKFQNQSKDSEGSQTGACKMSLFNSHARNPVTLRSFKCISGGLGSGHSCHQFERYQGYLLLLRGLFQLIQKCFSLDVFLCRKPTKTTSDTSIQVSKVQFHWPGQHPNCSMHKWILLQNQMSGIYPF